VNDHTTKLPSLPSETFLGLQLGSGSDLDMMTLAAMGITLRNQPRIVERARCYHRASL